MFVWRSGSTLRSSSPSLASSRLARLSRRSVASGKPRPLTSMSGWLSNMSLLYVIVQFHKLAGGAWFGTGMVLCTIMALLSDFAVSGLVQTVYVGRRCPFGSGLVISETFSPTGWWSVPPYNGAPFLVVSSAQSTSAANGGLVGVYWKVNRDTHFRREAGVA